MLLVVFTEKIQLFTADFWFEKITPVTNELSNLSLCHLAYAIDDL